MPKSARAAGRRTLPGECRDVLLSEQPEHWARSPADRRSRQLLPGLTASARSRLISSWARDANGLRRSRPRPAQPVVQVHRCGRRLPRSRAASKALRRAPPSPSCLRVDRLPGPSRARSLSVNPTARTDERSPLLASASSPHGEPATGPAPSARRAEAEVASRGAAAARRLSLRGCRSERTVVRGVRFLTRESGGTSTRMAVFCRDRCKTAASTPAGAVSVSRDFLEDRSALFGVLAEIEGLGLELLELRQIPTGPKSP